jgi:hypothetical protein
MRLDNLESPWANPYARLVVLIFVLNAVSAALFMLRVNRPVYDDPYNIFDVHTYATKGVSLATIRANRNPPGPTSFLWMAASVRLLGGDELLDARFAVLLSWVLLAAGILVGARIGRFPQPWLGALLAVLVFPHSVEATGLVLTEGPALLFATLGALVWIEFASRSEISPVMLAAGIAGGLSMGISVTCRQYNLALLPAALIFAVCRFRTLRTRQRWMWLARVLVSLAVAAIPVLLLVAIWKGLSSPGMATGSSYSGYRAAIGVNAFRPIIAAFSTGFYLVPLTFPAMWRVRTAYRVPALLIALLGGIAAGCFSSRIMQPGPLHTLVQAIARTPHTGHVVFGLIAAVAIYNVVAVGLLLWEGRSALATNPPLAFATLTVIFFVVEQFGVGGNLLFYDRYVLQMAPFLGIIAFSLLPRITYPRMLVLLALSAVSHVMLWRYAFSTSGL